MLDDVFGGWAMSDGVYFRQYAQQRNGEWVLIRFHVKIICECANGSIWRWVDQCWPSLCYRSREIPIRSAPFIGRLIVINLPSFRAMKG